MTNGTDAPWAQRDRTRITPRRPSVALMDHPEPERNHPAMILLLDEDTSVRASLGKLLEAEGHRVLTARDGAEALAWSESERVQLIVMDVNLGDEDGWETLGRLTAANGSAPLIMVTSEVGHRDRAAAAGVGAFMEKPIDVPAFLNVVDDLLSGNRNTPLKPGGVRASCRGSSRRNEAFRRDLEIRSTTPLDMSWFDRLHPLPSRKASPAGLPA